MPSWLNSEETRLYVKNRLWEIRLRAFTLGLVCGLVVGVVITLALR